MSKKFAVSISLNGAPEKVFAMLKNESYLQSRLEDSNSGDFKVNENSDKLTLTLNRTDDLSNEVPAFIGKIIGTDLETTETQTWPIKLDSNSEANGTLELKVIGKPATFIAVTKLLPNDSGTTISFDGTLTVDIAVIGSKVESFIEKYLSAGFSEIEAGGNEWLNSN